VPQTGWRGYLYPKWFNLRDEPVVWLRRDTNPPLYDSFMETCQLQGYRPNVVQEAGTFCECLHFTRGKLGITFLPSFMKSFSENDTTSVVQISGSPEVEYSFAFPRNRVIAPLDRFVKLLRSYLSGSRMVHTGFSDSSEISINR